ncbi:GNAT family N-acetyltransferase [Salininema proteolyticum]|uniref:GNAT family N-acetyltransferase n=1 Tax=Salininema proteolyticum TaxID=1607685 RepID=A0ABV8TSF0_9ACTN
MLGPEHVGERVVVRVRAATAGGRAKFTDRKGILKAVTSNDIVISFESGTSETIPLREIAASRVIPPRPTRFSEILDLEKALAENWIARDNERFSGWLLRAADGCTYRANSVLALSEPDVALDEALAYTEKWYGERGLPPIITISGPPAKRLDDELAARGWERRSESVVMAGPIRARAAGSSVVIADSPCERYFESVDERHRETLRAILTGSETAGFAELREGGEIVAWGRGVVHRDALMLSRVEVDPRHRRRGLATRIIDALEDWGASQGASRTALQVFHENEAAIALYAARGLEKKYSYWYRTRV